MRTLKVLQERSQDSRKIGKESFGKTMAEARDEFLLTDLLRGGNVVQLDTQRIVVRTSYPDYVNKLVISGSYDDMKPLYTIAHCWSQAATKYHTKTIDEALREGRKLIDRDDISSLPFVKTLGPSVIGNVRLKIAAMVSVGITDERAVDYGLSLPLDEFLAGIGRAKDGQEPFPAALAMS